MSRYARIRFLLITAVGIIAAAVWLAGETQRSAADGAAKELATTETLLVAMLDQETGLRGYAETGRRTFLAPYESGRREFEVALASARATLLHGDERGSLERQERAARSWQALAEEAVSAERARRPRSVSLSGALARKKLMDSFRAENEELRTELALERDRNQRRAGHVSVGLIVVLSLLFGALGYLLIERRARVEAGRRERQAHFADVMQLARTEAEAYSVVKRHLESTLPEARALVLNRNNSADRLEPTTPVPEDSPVREALRNAEPESCLAIRMGRMHHGDPSQETLLSCELCGQAGNSTCVPSLVGGEVIGSVLLEHPGPLGERQTKHLRATVAEAAPVIANLRNLALAEMRAATDALTGLPNNRASQETLRRLVAQADRTVAPLAASLFDLDHFKQINDTYGHGKGDEVLAAVGDALTSAMRASDVVGRYGGEEFLLLLPNTDRHGALLVTEKLRAVIARLRVPGVDRRISASFGVAVMPDDAGEATHLLRMADRALYTAKANGRDRVEALVSEGAEPPVPTHPGC